MEIIKAGRNVGTPGPSPELRELRRICDQLPFWLQVTSAHDASHYYRLMREVRQVLDKNEMDDAPIDLQGIYEAQRAYTIAMAKVPGGKPEIRLRNLIAFAEALAKILTREEELWISSQKQEEKPEPEAPADPLSAPKAAPTPRVHSDFKFPEPTSVTASTPIVRV